MRAQGKKKSSSTSGPDRLSKEDEQDVNNPIMKVCNTANLNNPTIQSEVYSTWYI